MNPSRTTITSVEPLAGRWLRLTFGDGAVHEVDLSGLLGPGGVLAAIRDDRAVLEAVHIDREFGTTVWKAFRKRNRYRAPAPARPLLRLLPQSGRLMLRAARGIYRATCRSQCR